MPAGNNPNESTESVETVITPAIFTQSPTVKKSTIVSMVENASKVKQKCFQTFSVTVPANGWSEDGTYDIPFGALTKKDMILMDATTISDSFKVMNYGITCDIGSVAVNGSGKVRLTCQEIPTESVTVAIVRFAYCAKSAEDDDAGYKARVEAIINTINASI